MVDTAAVVGQLPGKVLVEQRRFAVVEPDRTPGKAEVGQSQHVAVAAVALQQGVPVVASEKEQMKLVACAAALKAVVAVADADAVAAASVGFHTQGQAEAAEETAPWR
jgi:hypothetical protein